MRTSLYALFIMYASIGISQQSHTLWQGEIDFGDGFSLTSFLEVTEDNNNILITSPKNADVRLFGRLKAHLGRLFGRLPKRGVFLRITNEQKGDSLIGSATLPMLGVLEFKGILNENVIRGEFVKANITIGSLKGVKTIEKRIDYTYLYSKILTITEDNIFSKEVLHTKEWMKFQKQFERLCVNAEDDIELFIGFNLLAQQLSFSHYTLFIDNEDDQQNNSKSLVDTETSVVFEEKNIKTGYLKIKNFSSSAEELENVLSRIVNNRRLENLIVDLRNNGGGGIEAASVLSKYIVNDKVEVGYFTTNKLKHSGFDRKLFEELPISCPKTTDGFIEELKAGKGAKLVFGKGEVPVFTGQIFVLINSQTASTCEPIVYVLKRRERAVIVGERTAGAMLSAASFDIYGKYKLIIPIGDFYTMEGLRIDQVGVMPDIPTTSEQALNKVLELISSIE